MMTFYRRKKLWIALLLAGAASLSVWACNVPVFRYALERWPPDVYEAVVFHRGPLSQGDQKALSVLKQPSIGEGARVILILVDVAEKIPDSFKKLWEELGTPPLPVMAMRFPERTMIEEPFWSGPLKAGVAEKLLISPVRGEIARRLLVGDSSVFVLIEGEDRKENDDLAKKLGNLLKTMEKNLELPEQDPDDYAALEDFSAEATLPKLRLAFSVIRMKRTDPEEKMLLAMLGFFEKKAKPPAEKKGTPPAEQKESPMVYAFFGQGRALGPYFTNEITENNLYDLCGFLIGPCSCTVKDMNPGIDILINIDWEGLLTGRLVVDEELPPLSGFTDLVVDKALSEDIKAPEEAAGALAPEQDAGAPAFGDLTRNMIFAGGLIVIIALVATFVMRRP